MSDPKEEETRLRWADCDDEGRKEQVVSELVGLEIEEGEKQSAGGTRRTEESAGGTRRTEESAGGARERS